VAALAPALGTKTFELNGAERLTVHIRLSAAELKSLRKHLRLSARLTLVSKDTYGQAVTKTTAVKLVYA
jgi:hypothetical protein